MRNTFVPKNVGENHTYPILLNWFSSDTINWNCDSHFTHIWKMTLANAIFSAKKQQRLKLFS